MYPEDSFKGLLWVRYFQSEIEGEGLLPLPFVGYTEGGVVGLGARKPVKKYRRDRPNRAF